jgi:hypothetical protein
VLKNFVGRFKILRFSGSEEGGRSKINFDEAEDIPIILTVFNSA